MEVTGPDSLLVATAAEPETSVLVMAPAAIKPVVIVFAVATLPSPRLVRAVDAKVAPVPPLATATVPVTLVALVAVVAVLALPLSGR